jgi:hypothetical protein
VDRPQDHKTERMTLRVVTSVRLGNPTTAGRKGLKYDSEELYGTTVTTDL